MPEEASKKGRSGSFRSVSDGCSRNERKGTGPHGTTRQPSSSQKDNLAVESETRSIDVTT